jgi:hypothetical protein
VYASSFGEVFSLPLPIAQGIQPSTFCERKLKKRTCIRLSKLMDENQR